MRCRWACTYKGRLTTRCLMNVETPHTDHVGMGLKQNVDERIYFFDGDPRMFETDTPETYAWEE